MKYLDLETSKYLASLGCVSVSNSYYDWLDGEFGALLPHTNTPDFVPAFCLEDLLRKENAEKIWPGKAICPLCGEDYNDPKYCDCEPAKPPKTEWYKKTLDVVRLFQSHPDTWPEEVKKLILK